MVDAPHNLSLMNGGGGIKNEFNKEKIIIVDLVMLMETEFSISQ